MKIISTKKHGFTIVELLIVIVVIGILAAIVIVAYIGIQNKGSNARRVSAAKDWQKVITGYTQTNGAYPVSVINNHVCLGTGYPTNIDGNADEDCYYNTNVKHPVATINTAFKTVSGTLPGFPVETLNLGSGNTVNGISVRAYDTLDPSGAAKTQYPMLYYWLIGNNQDCVLRPVAINVSGGFNASTTATYTQNEGAYTRCVIVLPDPSAL